jgi:hypothetical protein
VENIAENGDQLLPNSLPTFSLLPENPNGKKPQQQKYVSLPVTGGAGTMTA